MLQAIGGRKFLLALISIAVGTAIELMTVRGITPAFAALLTGILTTFSATNWAISNAHFKKQMVDNKKGQINVKSSIDKQQLDKVQLGINELKELTTNVAVTTANTHKLAATAVGLPR